MLSEDKKLTFSKAIEIAQGVESAESKAKEFKGSPPAILKVSPHQQKGEKKPCHRCGRSNHSEQVCRFRQATCHNCGKVGHIAPACRSRKTSNFKRSNKKDSPEHTKFVELETTDSDPEELPLFTLGEKATNPIKVDILINGRSLPMELDTGAAVSIISDTTRKAIFPTSQLQTSSVNLKTYTGEPIQVAGELLVNVQHGQQEAKQLPLIVVTGNGPSLLGRNWLQHVRLDWKMIKKVTQHSDSKKRLQELLEKYKEVFQEELGHIKEFKAKLQVQENAKPKIFKPRSVPFAMKAAVDEELDRLEQIGVLEKISSSDWAAPIVTVPKKDGKVRLCGDYKVTINTATDVDQYPLPIPDALFATLSGGKYFTTLDLSQAYQQLELEESSRKYLAVNTHRGLYQYTRLPYGVASAPAQFQKVMDTILQGIPGVTCYIDDILITGATEEEHLQRLEVVLRRLQQHGFRLKKAKCKYMAESVDYLGYLIDSEGLHATEEKLQAILQAPTPRNVQELRSFLGLVNYYGKFISNLATILHPLNALL